MKLVSFKILTAFLIVLGSYSENLHAQVVVSCLKPSVNRGDTSGFGRVSFNDAGIALINNKVSKFYGLEAGTIPAEYKSSNTIKGIVQTFKWNSTAVLTGIGFLVSHYGTQYKTDQEFALDVQQLYSDSDLRVNKPFKLMNITIPVKAVRAGYYLYFQFTSPLNLEIGKTYGVNLYPVKVANQAVFFEKSNSAYLGIGGQSTQGRITTYLTSNNGYDFNFFLMAK
jgi:hypothetical protein